jgi:hypothetical protein
MGLYQLRLLANVSVNFGKETYNSSLLLFRREGGHIIPIFPGLSQSVLVPCIDPFGHGI